MEMAGKTKGPTESILFGWNSEGCGPLERMHRKARQLCRKAIHV
jgi:hypothetical protein